MKVSISIHIIMVVIFLFFSATSHSIDIVKIKVQQLSKNKAAHNIEVVRRALEITEPEFGPYKLQLRDVVLTTNREMRVLKKGRLINVVITPANKKIDKVAFPIRVPIRLGLLSYRLLLVNKVDLPVFDKIKTLDELKQVNAGLLHGWKTTGIYKQNNMKLVKTHSYEGMFMMLDKHRFDYIPRAIYEIYDELDSQRALIDDVVVEPSIALYIPALTYVYVSPNNPELAKRLDIGLHMLLNNGELHDLLYKYYGADIERANIGERKIIEIENSYYSQDVISNSKDLLSFH